MKPIRIVACTLSMGMGNGIARMDEALFRGLDRKRFQVTYCFTDITQPETVGHFPFHVPVPIKGRFDRLCELFRGADIVQFNGGFDPVVCEAATAAGVPTLIEVMHQCDRGQRSPAIHATVCVSEQVQSLQPFPERSTVIHNGVDTNIFRSCVERPNDRIILLEVAGRAKAVHFHLDELAEELLAIDPRIEIRLAGSGQEGNSLHDGRVTFLGIRDDMPELYSQAHFMVLASRQDAFGLACAEAMACGCLPVASNDGGMAEIVRPEADGWLFDGTDRDAFLRLIRHVVKREQAGELLTMRERARTTVVDRHSLDRCLAGFENLYEEACAQNGRYPTGAFHERGSGKRRSAEGLIGETLMGIQARMEPDAILGLWLDTHELSLSPMREPNDPYWLEARGMIRTLFEQVAEAGYGPLAATLSARLDILYPLPEDKA